MLLFLRPQIVQFSRIGAYGPPSRLLKSEVCRSLIPQEKVYEKFRN